MHPVVGLFWGFRDFFNSFRRNYRGKVAEHCPITCVGLIDCELICCDKDSKYLGELIVRQARFSYRDKLLYFCVLACYVNNNE